MLATVSEVFGYLDFGLASLMRYLGSLGEGVKNLHLLRVKLDEGWTGFTNSYGVLIFSRNKFSRMVPRRSIFVLLTLITVTEMLIGNHIPGAIKRHIKSTSLSVYFGA